MARTKASRGGRRPIQPKQSRVPRETDTEYITLQKEAERRDRIIADRLRVASKWRPKIPEVRKVNFENFKNRFHDVDERDYAVDVLVGGPELQAQIRREQGQRRREEIARIRQNYLRVYGGLPSAAPKTDMYEKLRRDKKNEITDSNAEVHRIRIQSQPILGHLTSLINDSEHRSTPRTFTRPFKALVYFQPKMKEILATLEEKWGDVEDLEEEEEEPEVIVEEGLESSSTDEQDDDTESLISVDSNADEDFDGLMDSPEALRDLRCYVEFIDKEIMPHYNELGQSTSEKVKFDDLWSLFRVGDLAYMPASGEAGGRYHQLWRIYKIKVPEPEEKSKTPMAWNYFTGEVEEADETPKFEISGYYIDHDGNSFGAVRRKFEIDSFVGERHIDSLDIFPIRFRSDHQQILASLKEQGHKFVNYLEDRHQQYSAWTLTRNPPSKSSDPEDEILQNEEYDKMRHPEFVESDVIVDLTEAYQKMPDWRPTFYRLALNTPIRCGVYIDETPIQHWYNGTRQTLAYSQAEVVQQADGVEKRQRRDNLNIDPFLRSRVRGSRVFESNPKALELRDEDLVLLPKRMFAYALRERRFLPIDLNLLKPIRREPGVFENLRIQSDYKDVVRGLVMSHFQRKDLERQYADVATEGPSQDLIQGKGRGLVVLLHGVPGVGKTATAEAVAMENRKPLFVITCGDLGLTPSAVEHSLKNMFRLAHLWDCVLLLDEADVFLAQRSNMDMKRNALVSVFLRVLEYYNGLLFLTTNRVGTIDEAFKSRIHLSLYYPPLDKTQTREIFRLNITKLRQIESERHRITGDPALIIKDNEVVEFASKHYEELARTTGCWNGRQIRSAFQIASSLAIHNYSIQAELARSRGQSPPAAPVLDRIWFEKVQMSTQSFDKHMRKENGSVESDVVLRSTFSQ